MLRVSTRVWFIVIFISLYLIGLVLERLDNKLVLLIGTLMVICSLIMGYKIVSKPINFNSNLASEQIYNFLAKDKSIFKVFCTTRCLSQKQAAIYNLHLADGYGTLQQTNYFLAAQQIGQYYSNRYSLSIPPYDIYLFNKLQPNTRTITAYNIKYIVSPHALKDTNFTSVFSTGKLTIYLNKLWKNPEYESFSPNKIIVTSKNASLTIPEIYSPDWNAYLDGNERVSISENSDHTIDIKTTKDAKVVDIEYMPKSFKVGAIITSITVIICAFILNKYFKTKII
jgi:hypothetical protein